MTINTITAHRVGRAARLGLLSAVAVLSLATPAVAAPVALTFQGTIPSTNSVFGSGSGPFTTFQNQFISQANVGNTYSFTFSYDTTATATGGLYPLTLESGRVGSFTNFSDFTPYIQFTTAGTYTYLNFFLRKDEMAGPNHFTSYATFNLGDNDGNVAAGVLPATIVPGDLDLIGAGFQTFGSNGSYREVVDSASRGLTQTSAVAGVPEPASWVMMIFGFGLVGAALRRAPHRLRLRLA